MKQINNDELSSDLQQQYARRFTPVQAYRQKVWRILVRDFFQNIIGKDRVILDLGCGWGEFINNIEAKSKYGMDLNPSAKERLNDDVQFLMQNCSEPWNMPPNIVDVVFTSNFFEHLPNKQALKDTLSEAFKVLKVGGRIVCMGPNIKYVPGAYWDFLDHHICLTERSLVEALELTGFKTVRVVDRFLPYTMVGSTPPLWLLELYLRIPLAWSVLGKQFLVIAEKVQP